MGVPTQKFVRFINDIRELYDEINYFRNFKKVLENVIFCINIMEKNKTQMSFSYCEMFTLFFFILIKDVFLNKETINGFLERSDITSSFTPNETKRIYELLIFLQIPTNFKIIMDRGDIDKNTFLKILIKLSEDSYYFKEYSINYTWILLYYQEYDNETNLYINKLQKNYIEQTIMPLFNYIYSKNVLGLSEYKKNLDKNFDFWKTSKNLTRKEFINGVY